MAVQVPPELQTPEVILRAMGSVMAGDTRSPAQKLLDLILGGNPAERMGGVAPMRIGVMPGREKIASDIIKRGLKEPWFHGTSYAPQILEGRVIPPRTVGNWLDLPGLPGSAGGFSPERIGAEHGLRLGEPAGVSLTRSPEVARKFGDVLRVGVDIPPSSVGQFVDPEMQRLLRVGYQEAKRAVPLTSFPEIDELTGIAATQANMQRFNQAMSDYLRNQGVEAIAFNPRRWAEYEMRVLDPSKAVPLGRMPAVPLAYGSTDQAVLNRYLSGSETARQQQIAREILGPYNALRPLAYGGLRRKLEQEFLNAPTFPARLRDVLGIAGAD